MSQEQQAVINEAMAFASEDLYAGAVSQARTEQAQQILDDAKKAFSSAEFGLIFTELGDPGSGGSQPGSGGSQLEAFCNCSTQSDQCWAHGNYTCTTNIITCTWAGSGCGAFWSHPCNGWCVGSPG